MEGSSVVKAPLDQAIEALKLKNLGLLKSRIDVDPDSVLGVDGNELTVLIKWGASKSQILRVEDKTTKAESHYFVVEIGTSLRMVDKARPDQAASQPAQSDVSPEPKVRAEIEATYIVTYDLDHQLELAPTALDEFARRNVMYHVWPYWRSYITDTLGRVNMPPFVLPMFSLAQQSRLAGGKMVSDKPAVADKANDAIAKAND